MTRRAALTSKQYTQGIEKLTAEKLEQYGRRIVSSSIALALLSKKAGRELDRNVIVQKCRSGKLRPMGKYKNGLYFWRKDIEDLSVNKYKKPHPVF